MTRRSRLFGPLINILVLASGLVALMIGVLVGGSR